MVFHQVPAFLFGWRDTVFTRSGLPRGSAARNDAAKLVLATCTTLSTYYPAPHLILSLSKDGRHTQR